MTNPKRPRDPNQLAKLIVGIATGETIDHDPDTGKSPVNIEKGRKGGAIGGKARAKALTPEQKSEIARKAAETRWKN
jgi:hypothetical protein